MMSRSGRQSATLYRVIVVWATTTVCALIATHVSAQCSPSWSGLNSQDQFDHGTVFEMVTTGPGCEAILYAAGHSFSGLGAPLLYSWNGSSWSTPSDGFVGIGSANALFYGDIGEGLSLYVCGQFQAVGPSPGIPVENIARWDPAEAVWHALGDGLDVGQPDAVLLQALIGFDDGVNGIRLYAGGNFMTPGGDVGESSCVAAWDGTAWTDVTVGDPQLVADVVYDFAVFDDGSVAGSRLYACGHFFVLDDEMNPMSYAVAVWNGSTWTRLGEIGGGFEAHTLRVWDDGTGSALFVGGSFESIDGVLVNGIAKWNGSSWSALGSGQNLEEHFIYDLCDYKDRSGNRLYAVGTFTSIGGTAAAGLASWDGSAWSTVGTGAPVSPNALITFDAGGSTGEVLIVAGGFTTPFEHLAQWGWCGYCVADTDHDGDLDVFDVTTFTGWLSGNDPRADLNCDGVFDFYDMQTYLGLHSAGCY